MEKKDILIIISLFFIAFLIRAPGVPNVCIYVDELLYWFDTFRILASNWVPTAEVFDYSPPFFEHIAAVATLFFGGDLNTLRMISVIFGSLTVPIFYLFGKAMYDRKTGLLSALFLCFSAYHCLYSRVIMLEALTLFFITAFLYFFWLGQRSEGRKSTTYACLAGAMLGLAIDAKYISLFLVPTVLAYVLWTKKLNFKALMDKQIILIFVFALLFFLPLLICLFYAGVGFQGILYFAFERKEVARITGTSPYEFPIDELLVRGVGRILEVFTWGADAEILIPPLTYLFKLSTIILLLLALFFYLLDFLNREKRSSFLMFSLFMLFILLLNCGNVLHYLIYSLPICYVMLSHLSVKSFEHLRRENGYKNILRILIVLLTVIMLCSSFITAVTSPYWDKGDYDPWIDSAVDYIKSDITKSGFEKGNVLIGMITAKEIVDYHLYLNEINVSTCYLLKDKGEMVDLESMDILKPTYIIASEASYDYCFKGNITREIFNDYRIVFHSRDYPSGCFVFKRKNTEPPEPLSAINGEEGEEGKIFKDVFKKSMPGVMEIGKVYTAIVKVENTGDYRTNFTVRVVYNMPNKYIMLFVGDKSREITLDKGSTHLFKFKIVPFRKYEGELPVTVDLYARSENETSFKKVDSVSDYVYRIL